MCLFELWFSEGICPVVGLLGHMVVLFLVFKEISILFSIWLYQLTFPLTVQEGSLFSISCPPFIVRTFFDGGHSDCMRWYLTVVFNLQRIRLQCRRPGFSGLGRSPGEGKGYPLQYSGLENSMDCYSPWGHKESDTTERLSLSLFTVSNNERCWASFPCVYWPSICLLWRNVFLGLLPIFWLGCLFIWYWAAWAACIFWRLILCQLLHLQLFSPLLRIVFSSCLWFPLLYKSF